jgi:N-acetylmuramoyl-L-alanine amidase
LLKIKTNENKDKYEVILTRDKILISLFRKNNLINKLNPEMVISLHVNSSPKRIYNMD